MARRSTQSGWAGAHRRTLTALSAAAPTVLVVVAVALGVGGQGVSGQGVGGQGVGGGGTVTSRVSAAVGPATAALVVAASATAAAAAEAPAVVGVPAPTPTPTKAERPTGSSSGGSGSTGSTRSGEGGGSDASCDVGSADGADQVVLVRSSGTRATVQACSLTSGGHYVSDLGPYSGYVGRSGVTSAGSKREGDGATPAGVYPLRGGFGVRSDPGLTPGWDRVDSSDVWVDDPDSSLYNTQQQLPADGRWSSAEMLANAPAYNYAQVIGYNESASPGRGSAIFLHVSTGGPTAGCVSVPTSALLALMRWQESGAVIAIR